MTPDAQARAIMAAILGTAEAQGLSGAELSRRAGVAKTACFWYRRGRFPRLDMALRVADAAGYRLTLTPKEAQCSTARRLTATPPEVRR